MTFSRAAAQRILDCLDIGGDGWRQRLDVHDLRVVVNEVLAPSRADDERRGGDPR